ncbi:QWRF motif-containing protein 2-like isoform X2 [Durio zibethinus]|uniref:QWRF motif-containing protein 2-like isoform X2 n=1 Tax=Durio zibethinus TaxID=66656 RepID=A0A6P6AUS9_DURZI|nr:QWRF motif-containing protein 2-like isoform X2 [Durio zibethinus]
MVAAVSATANPKQHGGGQQLHQHPSRPPLLPSEPDNGIALRRQKFCDVNSRYLCTASSSSNSSTSSTSSFVASAKRCLSPLVSRTSSHSKAITTPTHATPSAIKRSQSVERRYAVTPRPNNSMESRTCNGYNNSELSTVQKSPFTSTRSLSVSFQGESFSYQFSKAKSAQSPTSARKGTPERRKPTVATTTPGRGTDQTENSKTERWPARLRQPNSKSRSMDCTDERKRLNGSVNGNVVRALKNSMNDNGDLTAVIAVGSEAQCDPVASDTESLSSGSTSSCNGNGDVRRGPQGIMVPAPFWQETNSRLRRSDSGSSVCKKNTAHSKRVAPDKFGIVCPLSSPLGVVNSRGQLSPIRGPVRPASPSKLGASSTSSPLRGMSPSRVRNGLGSNLVNTPSILSSTGDVIKMGKIGENKVSDAYLLRLLHNRLLQWRFVNARADAALSSQRSNAEKIFLDEWAVLDNDYCSSLSGATEALVASTLRLPVVCGARADVPKLKGAICSVVDVMQAMASSICSLLSKVAKVNSLVAELGNLSANEFALLNQCEELLSTIAAMQVKEFSLRTHILQANRLPSSLTTKL